MLTHRNMVSNLRQIHCLAGWHGVQAEGEVFVAAFC